MSEQRSCVVRPICSNREPRNFFARCTLEAGRRLPIRLRRCVRPSISFATTRNAAQRDFGESVRLPGPTGERNQLRLHGRGVFACISPWNFPLVDLHWADRAALAAGNAVIAKPAEQTPLTATMAVQLL